MPAPLDMTQCQNCGVIVKNATLERGCCKDGPRCEQWRQTRLEVIEEFEQFGPQPTWLLFEDWLHRERIKRRKEKPDCRICGKEIPYESTFRDFCSEKCSHKAHSKQAMASFRKQQAPREQRTCLECGTDITAKRTDAVTCSDKCAKKRAYRSKRKTARHV